VTFIRYPGSKAKLARRIVGLFPPSRIDPLFVKGLPFHYCEPFFGSGAVAWLALRAARHWAGRRSVVVINDIDPGMSALWQAVRDDPDALCRQVKDFEPTPEAFYRLKEEDSAFGLDPVVRAFAKLALHQTSFSGLGAMAGGPLGGRAQRSQYNTACRWSPSRICRRVFEWHRLLSTFGRVDVFALDFAKVLAGLPAHAFAYLDPPYYAQGEALYKHAFAEADHVRLAHSLRDVPFPWALSYDDHPRVRELYAWAHIVSFEMTPTVQTARAPRRRKNREVIITPRLQS
jgi:DNA adenine methylase